MDPTISLADGVAILLALAGIAEMFAARWFAAGEDTRQRLIASLLLWEGFAMFAGAFILHFRQDFSFSTIVALIAIWLAGAGIGLLRSGVLDAWRE